MNRLFLLFLSIMVIFFNLSVYAKTEDDLKLIKDLTFSTISDGYLLFNTASGKVKITSWDKTDVNVKLYANENAENNMDFIISQAGADINVTGKMKTDSSSKIGISIRYEITVPKTFNIEAQSNDGNIAVSSVIGTKYVNTKQGNLKFDSCEGLIDASTLEGNIRINSGNGKVKASTMAGNISLVYVGLNSGIELNTMAGNIKAILPSDINGDADISTLAGKISCDFAQPENNSTSSSLKVKFNSGGEAIKISTAAGNINIEKK